MTIPKLNFKQFTILLLAISLCGYVGTTLLLAQQPPGKQWMAKYESGTEPIKRLTDVRVTLITESIVCEPKGGNQITLPLAKVKGVTYDTRVRHRMKEGSALMVASPLGGMILASTKKTKHYVTIESQENGTEKEVVLELGKNDYLAFLKELKNATGKDWKDLAQQRKNTEDELRREKDKAIAVKLEKAIVVSGVNLKPGQYQLVVLERPDNKGELHFFVKKVIPERSLVNVQVEIVAETNDIRSPELVYKETGGQASLSEVKLPTRKLRLL